MNRATAWGAAALAFTAASAAAATEHPRFAHVFVIIAENHGYEQIIGNKAAPNINRLAETYGSATQFYGEVHPSKANYIALLGGSTDAARRAAADGIRNLRTAFAGAAAKGADR